jgi:hypothetical protein
MENNDEKQKQEEKKVSKSNMESLTSFLRFLSVLAAILYLVGYGVALSVASVFGMPQESLFSSTFDLLELSAWAIVTIASNLIELNGYKNIYSEYLIRIWKPATIAFILLCVGVIYRKKFSKNFNLSHILKMSANIFRHPTESDSYLSWFTKLFFFVYGLLLLVPTLVITLIYALIVSFALFALVPLIGMSAGVDHIKRYVIEPTSCAAMSNRNTLMKRFQTQKENKQKNIDKRTKTENFATCISLKKENDSSEIFEGRLVYMTTNAAILFNPDSGEVQRIPTQDMTISIIDKL